MNHTEVGQQALQLSRMLASGQITTTTFSVGYQMLFKVRQWGRRWAEASYAMIAKAAGTCRRTAIDAVAELVELGVLRKEIQKRWGRWRWQGRRCEGERQCENRYWFQPLKAEPRGVQNRHPIPIASFKKDALEQERTANTVQKRPLPPLSQALEALGRRIAAAGSG